jgi:hypothetical protein
VWAASSGSSAVTSMGRGGVVRGNVLLSQGCCKVRTVCGHAHGRGGAVDRQERSVILYSEPCQLGYSRADGPHPYGTTLHIPAPFNLVLDTSGL